LAGDNYTGFAARNGYGKGKEREGGGGGTRLERREAVESPGREE